MSKRSNYHLENISSRRNKWNIEYNDYTRQLTLSNTLSVYQSGHKKYCPPNFKCGPDVYDHYIIHYITSGYGTFSNPASSWTICTGDAFLIRPYESVIYTADSVSPWTYYWVGFNGPDAVQFLHLCGFNDETPIIHYSDTDILVRELHAITALHLDGAAQECALLGHLYQLFSLLIQNNQKHSVTRYADYYYKAVQFIRLNYADPDLSVSSIADYIGISRSHLYRIFDSVSHQSVQDCILDFRLKKAAALLKNSSAAIGEIAQSCGFGNQSHFTSIFKQYYGDTPSSFRIKS